MRYRSSILSRLKWGAQADIKGARPPPGSDGTVRAACTFVSRSTQLNLQNANSEKSADFRH